MNVPLVFFLFFFIMVAAIGASLARAGIRPARRATLSSVLALPVLLAMGGIAAVLANLDAVRANIAYKQARFALLAIGREDWAIERVQHALSLEPARNAYRVLLGELLTRKGQLAKKPEARNELFHEAEKTLRAAAEMSPLDPDPLWKLARFYATWAVRTNNADRREERFRTSLGYYERTVHRWPGNVLLWNELAALHLSMGNRARAVEMYRHSLALDDRFVRTYLQLGDLYERGGEWKQAVEAYQGAVEKDPSFLPGYHALARAYVRRGSLDDAIRAHEQSIAHHPDDPRSHRELARLYFSTGQFALARIHAERALALVPPGERPAMERLLAQVDRAVAASR